MYIRKGLQHRQIPYDEMEQYGKLLKQSRISIGFNTKQMASEIGISVHTLRRWEKGECIPQTDIRYLELKVNNIINKYKTNGVIKND